MTPGFQLSGMVALLPIRPSCSEDSTSQACTAGLKDSGRRVGLSPITQTFR